MHMFNVSTLYRQSIKLLNQKLWYELIGPWRHHLCIYKSLIREKLSSSHSCHFVKNYFFLTKLIHAYVQWVYIVLAKYQIASSKAVVGVDRPMKAPSMHIQKPYIGKIVKVLTAVIL